MKRIIPLLILMSLLITEAVAQDPGPPSNVRVTVGDRSITVTWEPPIDQAGKTVASYHVSVRGAGGGVSRPPWPYKIEHLGQATSTNDPYRPLENGFPYSVRVSVRYKELKPRTSPNSPGVPYTAESVISATPMIPAPTGLTVTFDDPTTGDRTATLSWTAPPPPPSYTDTAGSHHRNFASEPITGYEYSQNGGPWIPTGSTSTTHSVTGLENGVEYSFRVRAVRDGASDERNGRVAQTGDVTLEGPRRRVIQDCPVGWVRSDGFTGRNRRVLLYEVKLDMDFQNRVSIYKPVWVAIYVHPDEGLENLDGWKLQVAVPYNHHRDYLLTAENSVVVDAGFVEGGFAFIENPKENPFPMVGMGFTGSPVPGFDYRLYDDTGRRVDFGIACYKRFDIFQVLRNSEDPRVLRKVLLESFDWDQWFLRSEWTVPTLAPAAPSLVKKSVVGTWADLKKQ